MHDHTSLTEHIQFQSKLKKKKTGLKLTKQKNMKLMTANFFFTQDQIM